MLFFLLFCGLTIFSYSPPSISNPKLSPLLSPRRCATSRPSLAPPTPPRTRPTSTTSTCGPRRVRPPARSPSTSRWAATTIRRTSSPCPSPCRPLSPQGSPVLLRGGKWTWGLQCSRRGFLRPSPSIAVHFFLKVTKNTVFRKTQIFPESPALHWLIIEQLPIAGVTEALGQTWDTHLHLF